MPELSSPGSKQSIDSPDRGRILIIDDEADIRDSLETLLTLERYTVSTAATGAEGIQAAARFPSDLVLLDLMLPDLSGLEVLEQIRKNDKSLPVVMLTAYGSVETAVKAIRLGANNFLTKPWNNEKLLLEIQQTLTRRRLEEENARLRGELQQRYSFENIVGKSDEMQRIFLLVEQVAPSRSTVLISGESGTGKELIAKAIHANSPRAGKPFVPVNSGSIPVDLLESTLFGHVRGAFTGAVQSRKGCFEIADGGTIFLDEVGTLGIDTQAKLLRVIQEREFMPVGSTETVRVNVRIVAATNEDLQIAVAEGRFREDLFYRLNVIGVHLPPLRERRDDIPLLVDHFLTEFCRREQNKFLDENDDSTLAFSSEAMRILLDHDWPGNVRELENVIERAVVLATNSELTPEVFPDSLLAANGVVVPREMRNFQPAAGASLSEIVEEFERKLVESQLEKHGYNQTETAKVFRVALSTLNQKIQRLGIELKKRREST
jgi:DNA-binding NtrC family response regulator